MAVKRDYMGVLSDQFECWKDGDIAIREPAAYDRARTIASEVYRAPMSQDPTQGSRYFNNPDKESADWTSRVQPTMKIGGHQFYK